MNTSQTYLARRGEIEAYFDRTAVDAWKRLTSDAPVSGIRATVRAGREQMRNAILAMLPADPTGLRILDAGCGTGALAVDLARRGAHVVAIDLSPTLVGIARERHHAGDLAGTLDLRVGDMLDPTLGRFDHVVAMDALIHYRAADMVAALSGLADCCRGSLVFTFAPRTPALAVMHAMGRMFPKSNRAPAIEPIHAEHVAGMIAREPRLRHFDIAGGERVSVGFYMSQAMRLVRR